MTRQQIDIMELANEFVSRKTLPEFYNSVGGKMQHEALMSDRPSTGYNRWVRNYCKAIEKTGADPDGVLADVRNHLFTEAYNNQATGLASALINNGAKKADGTKFKKMEANRIIKNCLAYTENDFEKYITAIHSE